MCGKGCLALMVQAVHSKFMETNEVNNYRINVELQL